MMNIKPTNLPQGLKTYQEQGVQAKKAGAAESKKNSRLQPDEVILSRQSAGAADTTVTRIRGLSDVRPDIVAEIKEKVIAGEYSVSAHDIALKILAAQKGEL
jgi:flagellar biosynthesis anti-sigma factor FlgM